MNKKSILLILLLALPLITPLISVNVSAYPVTTTPSTTPKVIEWYSTTADPTAGTDAYTTLSWNPEYLQCEVLSTIDTVTTITIEGKDTYGEPIEASVVIQPTPYTQATYVFNDTVSNEPVAFAQITGIIQQNGTDNTKFLIATCPWPQRNGVPYPLYLGQFSNATGYEPGVYSPYVTDGVPAGPYLLTEGPNVAPKVQGVPVEPYNPDPYLIAVNWVDTPNAVGTYDLIPTSSSTFEYSGATGVTSLYLESLDENGNKIWTTVPITIGETLIPLVTGCTFSSLCKVYGGYQGDCYYIFTDPMPARPLFYYYINIDHMTLHPDSYDILANPAEIDGCYPGVTNITVALRDIDGNLVNAADYGVINGIEQKIEINFFTTGGEIQPSEDVNIAPYTSTVTVNLTADTNPRTIKVTADANIPNCTWHGILDLFTWTEMDEDGVNSVGPSSPGAVLHELMWGYTPGSGASEGPMPVPAQPVLPPELGGPNAEGIKLNGPIYEVSIPLYVGCNLISCPVSPLLGTTYYTNYPTSISGASGYNTGISNQGIPMSLLFGDTTSSDIEAVWWYNGTWNVYIPGDVATAACFFRDGVGYWIKVEKPCTLEISGVWMENAPFTPPTYQLQNDSWNLMGVTSLSEVGISEYLSSTSGSSVIGPVWVYYAWDGAWVRNPSWGLWPGEAFWVYNSGTSVTLAP
jgi:hypothetical protein